MKKVIILAAIFSGSSFAYSPNECDVISNPACIPAGGGEDSGHLRPSSNNGYPTEYILKNKGGYNARYTIEYKEGLNGEFKTIYSPSLPSGRTFKAELPGDAVHVYIKAQRHTGFSWRDMYEITVDSNNNTWTYNSEKKNAMQIDNWGTTLNPKWDFQQPNDTHFNGG